MGREDKGTQPVDLQHVLRMSDSSHELWAASSKHLTHKPSRCPPFRREYGPATHAITVGVIIAAVDLLARLMRLCDSRQPHGVDPFLRGYRRNLDSIRRGLELFMKFLGD